MITKLLKYMLVVQDPNLPRIFEMKNVFKTCTIEDEYFDNIYQILNKQKALFQPLATQKIVKT